MNFFYSKVNRKRCRKFRKSCCSHRTEWKKLSFRPSWVCKQITIPIGNLVVSINHINTSCYKGDLISESFSISQKMCQIHILLSSARWIVLRIVICHICFIEMEPKWKTFWDYATFSGCFSCRVGFPKYFLAKCQHALL